MDRSTAVSNSQPPQYISNNIINHIWGPCWTRTHLIRFNRQPGTERVQEKLISTARCVDSDFPLLIATLRDEREDAGPEPGTIRSPGVGENQRLMRRWCLRSVGVDCGTIVGN